MAPSAWCEWSGHSAAGETASPKDDESERWTLRIPPRQHAERFQRDPLRRSIWSVIDVEPCAAFGAPIELPPAVGSPLRAYVDDCVGQPGVALTPGEDVGAPKVLEAAKNAVEPPVRVDELEEALVGRLAGAEALEQPSLKQVLLARPARLAGRSSSASGLLERQEPLEHGHRRME